MGDDPGRRLSARERGYTSAWDKASKAFLAAHPLCAMCQTAGRVTAATVTDHIIPHRGDYDLFWDRANWAPLCGPHHDTEKRITEHRGYSEEIGPDGFPVDPRHPFNGGKVRRFGYSIPAGTEPSAIPVTIVCGPPGAGKTTFVRERATAADMVIDLDDILEEIGAARWSADPVKRRIAMRVRDRMIRTLATATAPRAWLVVGAPSPAERTAWRAALGPLAELVVLKTAKAECLARIAADPRRAPAARAQIEAVRRWT